MNPTPLDIAAAFENAAAAKPTKPLVVTGNGTLTYGGLLERTDRLSGLLKGAGIKAGDRAIISSRDDIEVAAAFLGLLRNGVAPVLIDPRLPDPEAARLVVAAKAGCAFLDKDIRHRAADTRAVFEVGKKSAKAGFLSRFSKKDASPLPSYLEAALPAQPPPGIDRGSDAYILFTSGTTSRPKGVRISHSALFTHLGTLSRQFGLDEASRILNVLPLNHADGIVQGPLAAFFNSATLYRPLDFSVQNITGLMDSVYRERITHFVAVPTMLSLINRLGQGHEDGFATEDFQLIISTAAYLEQRLWEEFEKRFKVRVANVYGLTETVTGALFCGPGNSDRRVGTIGKPADCEARIMREDGSEAPAGEAGELFLKGDNIMTGYFEDAEATREALSGGWLRTGDIAVKDVDGYYRIAGRKKNVIISGGRNIHPEEVTETLKEHPDVLEAVTFGVEDETWGERVVSCVALAPGSSYGERALVEFCRSRIAEYKVPTSVYILPELPKGPSGKVVIPVAKKMALESLPPAAGTIGNLKSRVRSAAANTFKTSVEEISSSSTPAEIPEWDSLAHLQFVVALEEAFGIRLAPADIIRIQSIGDAERIVGEKLSS
ncbi:MAG: AMP-binding protein [Candidatus Methylomirabilis sp.]|nr:AMP-binding protein [Deltaproteobacteria bacterium]